LRLPRGLYWGPDTVHQFAERLNDRNHYQLYLPEEHPKQFEQGEIIEIFDQEKAPGFMK
jgi:hypothetical protein